nr:sterol carrier family protein [Mycolicibacterium malmesburyense]CRL67537.1 hypothetical protein CPGR_00489 [Mycolicibacterium malmesburyense]
MATARRARTADPVKTRAAVAALADWLRDEAHPEPSRTELGEAVRLTARTLAAVSPGSSVEVRVPPFVAVQCIEGPAHRRGNPPNVVETDPRTWLLMAAGLTTVADAAATGRVTLSGSRASEITDWLPLVDLGPATVTGSADSPEPS